jgi:Zn-dependent M28 family amino/carboxypeptidase
MKRLLQLGLSLLVATTLSAATFEKLPETVIQGRLQKYADTNRERETELKALFTDAGCGNLTEQRVPKLLPNVVCVLPGETDSTIIVGAHYDKVAQGDGVVDNWSGASLLPSLFESLHTQPRRHTFIFIGFTSEEDGLLGSKYYVSHLPAEKLAKTEAMVNMDSLGLTPTKVWVSHSDPTLLSDLEHVAQQFKLPLEGVNVEDVGTSDGESFAKKKIPRITIHSVTQETLPILHSARDTLDAIQPNAYYDSYRLIAAYLVYLDTKLETKPAQLPK